MSTGSSSLPVTTIYGLSTEGYKLASSIALKGAKVSLVDDSAGMAISLKPDLARTYPNVNALIEDGPLLAVEPLRPPAAAASLESTDNGARTERSTIR